MDDKLTTIYTAATPVQARLLQNLLDDEGIRAYVVNDALQTAVGDVPCGWATAVRVAVSSTDAEKARAIAEGFDRRIVQPPPAGIAEASDLDQAMWPDCPECRKPRTVVCPWCGTAGTRFPVADPVPADESAHDSDERWLCPMCDEPVEGQFLRRCEWCNHDFGSGVQLPSPVANETDKKLNLNPRVVVCAVGLASFVILLLCYFAIVLAR